MNKKAATPSLTIKLENVTILVNQVKGDQSLFRVMVDNTFKGYVMIQGKEIEMVSGSSINENYIDEIGKALCS